MAANKGVTLFVLLLYCCHKAEQPINMSSGPSIEISPRAKTQEDMTGVFDEVLVQEMLNPNKSSRPGTHRTTAMLSKTRFRGKNAGTDENNQVGPKSYHELSDNSQLSPGSEDKILKNESSVKDNYPVNGPEGYETKNSKTDQNENLSILDKILENIRKYSGILSNKLKRTSEAQRAESGPHGRQRGISVKQEILTE